MHRTLDMGTIHLELDEDRFSVINCKWVKTGGRMIKYQVLGSSIIIKIKIHSSCEIEDFVETHLCKLCVILLCQYYTTAVTDVITSWRGVDVCVCKCIGMSIEMLKLFVVNGT